MAEEFQYDVFISYSSADRPWALKLADELEARGITPFIDRKRLEAGKFWEPQLKDALESSRHMVALWSNNSAQSNWVQRELATFDYLVSSGAPGQAEQRLIFVNLEGQNVAYTAFQMIDDLKEAKVSAADITTLTAAAWNGVLTKVVGAIRNANATTPILTAVLTATRKEMSALDAAVWDELEKDLEMPKAKLLERYGDGAARLDWQPFGGGEGVVSLLDKLVDDINLAVGEQKFHRELVGDDFWQSDAAAEAYAPRFIPNVSLVVIDPIALYVNLVFRRLVLLQKSFESDLSVILLLPPFAPPATFQRLRQRVRMAAAGLLKDFLEPPVPLTRTLANCGVCVADEGDIKRLMRMTVGNYVQRGRSSAKSLYTSV
jgi:hypothetical protein